MSKPVIGSLLALALAASLAACSKEQPAEPAAQAPAEPAASEMAAKPHPVPTEAVVEVDLSGIEPAEGGQTIAAVYAGKDELAGETVTFRGKVVKVNANIMGTNWLHVRDGSGEEGTNDLTVTTTKVVPQVGDTVVVTGPVALDRDFGMGYRYPVIIEDAAVVVESSEDDPE